MIDRTSNLYLGCMLVALTALTPMLGCSSDSSTSTPAPTDSAGETSGGDTLATDTNVGADTNVTDTNVAADTLVTDTNDAAPTDSAPEASDAETGD